MRRGAAIFISIILFPLAYGQAGSTGGTDASRCPALEWIEGVGDVCRLSSGLLEVFSPVDGHSLGFTHGPDPLCLAECHNEAAGDGPTLAMAGSTTPHCVVGTSSEYFVRVIYARAHDDTDRYASMLGTIRNLVGAASAMVDDAAIATGDRLSIRTKCLDGLVVVDNVVLPTNRNSATYATVISDLENKGYTSIRQKNWVYYDDAGACACSGIGHIYSDDSNSVNNANNGASGTQAMFAISFDSPAVRTLLHELGHNLGAVQNSAPRSSGAGHCTDGRDTMCYNDGGSNSAQCQPDFACSGVCSVEVFDCGKNTYCHANPAAGSYLATHWQVCHRQSRFLQWGANVAPVMTALSCSPSPATAGSPVTCTFEASDGNIGVHYNVAWGDGSTTRVPSTGTVAPGTSQQASHTYASAGDRTVSVNATDSGTPQETSVDRTIVLPVSPANVAPTVAALECAAASFAEGETITCTFSANDENEVSYQITWGDGTAPVRVPAAGVVAPEAPQDASHAYTRGGTFSVNVTATDNGLPARSSSPATNVLDITEVNTAPVVTGFDCPTTLIRVGVTFSCTIVASDDSPGVRYHLDWGDGTTTTLPATGYVAPGIARTVSHSYNAEGDYTLSLVATDDFAPPASSDVFTRGLTIFEDISGPSIELLDPAIGMAYIGCSQQFSKGTGRALLITRGCARVDAADPSGVARVEILQNNVVIAVDLTAPYELVFPVPLAETSVAFVVRAYDSIGYVSTLRFTVDTVLGTE